LARALAAIHRCAIGALARPIEARRPAANFWAMATPDMPALVEGRAVEGAWTKTEDCIRPGDGAGFGAGGEEGARGTSAL